MIFLLVTVSQGRGYGHIEMLIDALFGVADTVIKRIWPDPTEAEKAKLEMLKAELSRDLAQIEVNKEEAKHPSIFVAGWRPFVGWVCASGFAYAFLLRPFLAWISLNFGWVIPPEISVVELTGVLGGMLGFGAMRTVEGLQGSKRSIWG